jgi:hypothetical protein
MKKLLFIGLLLILFVIPAQAAITKYGEILQGASYDGTVVGGYLYMGTGFSLRVYDVSTPAIRAAQNWKTPLGHLNSTGSMVKRVKYDTGSGFIFLACCNKMAIVNITNAKSPTIESTLSMPGKNDVNDIVIKGNYAFVSNGGTGVEIIDISNKRAPVKVARYSGNFASLTIQGDKLYAGIQDGAKGTSGFTIIDISVPSSPVTVATKTMYDANNSVNGGVSTISALGIKNGYIFALQYKTGVHIVQESSMKEVYFGTGSNWYNSGSGGLSDLTIVGDYLFTNVRYNGVRIYDIRNPAKPVYKGGTTSALGYEEKIFVTPDGNTAYSFTAGDGGLIYNTANKSSVKYVAKIITLTGADTAQVFGNRLYIGANNYGVWSWNITDPRNPTEESFLYIRGRHWYSAKHDNYIVYASAWGHLNTIDISDPLNMKLVTTAWGDSDAHAVTIWDDADTDCVYGADDYSLFNFTDPLHPVRIKPYNNLGGKGRIYKGKYLVIPAYPNSAGYRGGLAIFDVSDPVKPVRVGSTNLSLSGKELDIWKDYAVVVLSKNTIITVDISNVSNPVVTATASYPGKYTPLYVQISSDGIAYTEGTATINIRSYDITDPKILRPMDSKQTDEISAVAWLPSGLIFTGGDKFTGGLTFWETSSTIQGQVAADFSCNPVRGSSPLTVNCAYTGINGTRFNWSWGDGTYSTDKNPSHAYKSGGIRTVIVNASNSQYFDVETKTDYIDAGKSATGSSVITTTDNTNDNNPTIIDTIYNDYIKKILRKVKSILNL